MKISQSIKEKKILHWPTLNTVIMVEDTLRKANESILTIAELKRKLPRQVNHNTLISILEYLERSNKIAVGLKGVTWIFNPNPLFRKSLAEGFEV